MTAYITAIVSIVSFFCASYVLFAVWLRRIKKKKGKFICPKTGIWKVGADIPGQTGYTYIGPIEIDQPNKCIYTMTGRTVKFDEVEND